MEENRGAGALAGELSANGAPEATWVPPIATQLWSTGRPSALAKRVASRAVHARFAARKVRIFWTSAVAWTPTSPAAAVNPSWSIVCAAVSKMAGVSTVGAGVAMGPPWTPMIHAAVWAAATSSSTSTGTPRNLVAPAETRMPSTLLDWIAARSARVSAAGIGLFSAFGSFRLVVWFFIMLNPPRRWPGWGTSGQPTAPDYAGLGRTCVGRSREQGFAARGVAIIGRITPPAHRARP